MAKRKHTRRPPPRRAPPTRPGGGLGRYAVAVAAVAVVGALAAWAILSLRSPGADSNAGGAVTATAARAIQVAGVQVDQPSVDLGKVPLDTPVSHEFEVHNVGTGMAMLGQATIEVLEGC